MRLIIFRAALVPVLASVALAGCGGGSHKSSSSSSTSATTSSTSTVLTPSPGGGVVTIPGPVEARPTPTPSTPPSAQVAQKCPAGKAQMGCAVGAAPNLHRGPGLATPPVALFPDVSVWQGAVSWSAVAGWQRSHGWRPMAIWKMGEYSVDSQARRNASETRRLGFLRAGYWFVRNTGCAHEAQQIIAEGRAEGLKAVVEDAEVPEARGYAACLTPQLQTAGFTVIEYTSPGSNPDGSSNAGVPYLWVAAYGPAHVPCLFVCTVGPTSAKQTIVAWQFTDGRWGFVTNVPGIGMDDVSADYGMSQVLSLTPIPPSPTPAAPRQLSVLLNETFSSPWGKLNERATAAKFLGAYAHPAKYRGYLHGLLRAELAFLAGRIYAVAVTQHKGYHGSNRGPRLQFLLHDAEEASNA